MMINLKSLWESLIAGARNSLDIRDFFCFGGLALLGYGLWLLRPWLGFAVVGLFFMLLGFLPGRKIK